MADLYKIKPLEWIQHSNGRLWGAETVFGDYAVGINRDGEAWWSDEDGEAVWAGDFKEAQAAAEAHYRQQLAQHLEPVPEGAQWQPIETAPKDGWRAPLLTCRMGAPASCFGDEPVSGYAEPPEAAYWNEQGDCWTPCQRPHDRWKPTHWMPWPAAPVAIAKVEKADG